MVLEKLGSQVQKNEAGPPYPLVVVVQSPSHV